MSLSERIYKYEISKIMYKIMPKHFKLTIIVFILFETSCVHYISNYHGNMLSGTFKKVSMKKAIRDIIFFPTNGERFRLSELKDKKAVVLIMRDRGCPTSGKYGPHLARLETQYSKLGIQFIYIYVGQLDSLSHGKKDLKEFNFKAPYVIDIKQTIVNAVSAQTASEVLILTPNNRKLIYRGPLNDQNHLLNSVSTVKNNSVSSILDAIISGKKLSSKGVPAPECIIVRPAIKRKLFYKDVAPIISRKCSVCHNPSGSGFINYVTYEDIVKRSAIFNYVIENNLMPPWYVDPNTGPWQDDLSLTSTEKAMLLKWIDDGYPKTKRKFKPLWKKKARKAKTIDNYTIRLPEKVEIPAEGLNKYKHFIIPTYFREDKWIDNIEFFLKPKIIHHIILFIMDNSFPYHKDLSLINIRDYAAHSLGVVLSASPNRQNLLNRKNNNKNIGYRLIKKSKMVLEIHYESIGQKIVDDYTHVKINFHKKKPKYKIITHTLKTKNINIAPNKFNYRINMSYKLKKTRYFLGIFPHMHLRGKASSLYITSPDGHKKKVFGIDPYLANFQRYYELKSPVKIMKGSILECINWFDNSISNPTNPAPGKHATWGKFLENEMSECYIKFLTLSDSNEQSSIPQLIKDSK